MANQLLSSKARISKDNIQKLQWWSTRLHTALCFFTLALTCTVQPASALPFESGWGKNLSDGAFVPVNRRGPNPVHQFAAVNPNVGIPGGRLESDGGSGSGNYHLEVPLLAIPGRGLNLSLTAQFNSQIWSKIADDTTLPMFTYDIDGDWPVPGWNFGFGKLVFPGDPLFIEPNGTRRPISIPTYERINEHYTGRVTSHFLDGSGGKVECPVGSNGCNNAPHLVYVTLDNGNTMEMFSTNPGNILDDRTYYPQRITDANGNFILIAYRKDTSGIPTPPNIDHITDTVGRVIQFHYDSRNLPIAITGPDQNGGVRTYARFYYHQHNETVRVPMGGESRRVISSQVNIPVLDAILFPGNSTGYVFTDFTKFGIPNSVNTNRNMTASSGSLTEQGSFGSGLNTHRSVFDYSNDWNEMARFKTTPRYRHRIDSWVDLISGANPQATTSYEVQEADAYTDGTVKVTSPDGSAIVQAANADGLAQWIATFGTDGHRLTTTQYLWEPGFESVARQKEVRITNHEINAVARTEFRYGSNNLQVTEVISHDYAAPDQIDQAPIKSHKVVRYLDDPAYRAKAFNLVAQTSLFNGKVQANPAYAQWQQHLEQLQQILNQAKNDAKGPQDAVDRAQAAYDTRAGQEPEPTIENSHGAQIPNPLHRKWVTDMARLQNNLDAAKANAVLTQAALQTAQINYNSVVASPPSQTTENESSRTTYKYDAPTLIGLNPKPTNFTSNIDPFAARGLVTQVTRWLASDAQSITDGVVNLHPVDTSYVYDEAGNHRETHNSPGSVTTFTFTEATQYSLPEKIEAGSTDPASDQRVTLTSTYDIGPGLVRNTTDADGKTTQFFYVPGDSGWRVASVRMPTGVATSNKFQDKYLSVETTIADAEGRKYLQTSRIDGRGQLRDVRTRRKAGGGHEIQEFRYDNMGRKVQVLATKRTTESNLPERWTQWTYDSAGRLSGIKDPAGNVNSFYYNESARPPGTGTTLGTTTRSVDPWQREHWSLSNAFTETTFVVMPDPTTGKVQDQGGQVSEYRYDDSGHLVKIRNGTQDRTSQFDSLGRVVGIVVPEREATLDVHGRYQATGGRFSDVYEYDDLSNLVAHIDSRGAKTNFRYDNDPLNRLQRIDYDLTGVGDSLSPIPATAGVVFGYLPKLQGDPRRLVSSSTPGTLDIVRGFDSFGRGTSETWSFKSPSVTVPYQSLGTLMQYDSLGRLVTFTYPPRYRAGQFNLGPKLGYTYSPDAEIARIDLDGSKLVDSIDHGVLGLRSMSLYLSGSKIQESRNISTLTGRLMGQSVTGPDRKLLMQLGYGYHDDKHSNETGQILLQTDTQEALLSRRNEYDARGRLITSYKGPQPPTNDSVRQSYQYDALGNRTSSTGERFDPPTNSWNRWEGLADGESPGIETSTNRITQSGFLYDKAGNLIQRPNADHSMHRYIYDAAERLVRVEDSTGKLVEAYIYGADRRRVGVSTDLSHWRVSVWSGGTELGRYDQSPSNNTLNWLDMPIYFGGRLLAELSQNAAGTSSLTTFHQDQRGTSLATTVSTTGSLVAARQTVRPFGTEDTEITTTDDERRFTSYRRSARTGLDYATNRFYDSKLGRFTQPDPSLRGLNLYAYAEGDPINRTDPSGLVDIPSGCKDTRTDEQKKKGDPIVLDCGQQSDVIDIVGEPLNTGPGSVDLSVGSVGSDPSMPTDSSLGVGRDSNRCSGNASVTSRGSSRGYSLGGSNWSPFATWTGQPRETSQVDKIALGMMAAPFVTALTAAAVGSAEATLLYEIGQKTLADEAYSALPSEIANGSAAVRGEYFVQTQGWFRAIFDLNLTKAFTPKLLLTGPTPGAAGAIGFLAGASLSQMIPILKESQPESVLECK